MVRPIRRWITRTTMWGNSFGVHIPRPFARLMGLDVGDRVHMEIVGDVLHVRRARPSEAVASNGARRPRPR